jgi:hypothetical protein
MSIADRDIPHAYTLFSQPWWLDAVAPGAWAEAVVRRGSEIVGRLPYVVRRRMGLTVLDMPPLTQTLGPWIAPREGKYATTLGFQLEVMAELIAQLPRFDVFQQNFHYAVPNWLPFYWRGFEQSTRYTYVIDDLSDLDRVWRELQENVRRNIRKAQKQLRVRTDDDIRRFVRINALTFARQGLPLPYPPTTLFRLDRACARRDSRRIFVAEDAHGQVHAALYLVWDRESAYLLLSGADPALRQSGATSLLTWEAIRFAAGVTRRFDFEGSMVEPIERFFRHFGGRQVPYLSVRKQSRRARIARSVRESLRGVRAQLAARVRPGQRLGQQR